jgi:hypothetical protein
MNKTSKCKRFITKTDDTILSRFEIQVLKVINTFTARLHVKSLQYNDLKV